MTFNVTVHLFIFTCTVGWRPGPYAVPPVDIPSWCSFNGITCDRVATSPTYRSVKVISYTFLGGRRLLLASITGISITAVSATLPSIITNFINLQELTLKRLAFTGTIPASIYGMSALTKLDLSINRLTGTIASAIGTATKLVSLFLHENLFEGTIPSSIGSMESLTVLYLYSNSLRGTIPTTIVSMTNLRQLLLTSNSLTGTIPDDIGSMRTYLKTLSLGFNQLTGTIPSTFNQLNLLSFSFDTNYLTMGSLSTVPPSTFSDDTIGNMGGGELLNNCLAFAYGTVAVTATHCKPTAGKLIILCRINTRPRIVVCIAFYK